MTTPKITVSLRRRELIIDTNLFIPGMVPIHGFEFEEMLRMQDLLMTDVIRALIVAREALCRENSDRVSYACLMKTGEHGLSL